MATIQVRDVPEDAYETIRRRAREERKSIQVYMLDLVIEIASHPTKTEVLADLEMRLADDPSKGVLIEYVMGDLDADRR